MRLFKGTGDEVKSESYRGGRELVAKWTPSLWPCNRCSQSQSLQLSKDPHSQQLALTDHLLCAGALWDPLHTSLVYNHRPEELAQGHTAGERPRQDSSRISLSPGSICFSLHRLTHTPVLTSTFGPAISTADKVYGPQITSELGITYNQKGNIYVCVMGVLDGSVK